LGDCFLVDNPFVAKLQLLISGGIIGGLGIALGIFVFVYPQAGRVVQQTVNVTATVPDHGQGYCKGCDQRFSGSLPVSQDIPGYKPSISILFVGDIMLDRTVATRSRKAGDLAYPFLRVGNLKDGDFGRYDLAVGNLEGPVTSKRQAPVKSIDFMFDPKVIDVLKAAGFDALSQANNHALDQGWSGFGDSYRRLFEAGLQPFGHETLDDATSSLVILEKRGRKIALLGFNTTSNPLDRKAALEAVRKARIQADFVVPYVHWGNEYKDKPHTTQVELAHWFIDNGADAVIGGHPHWMESIEKYRGRPIVYSLGNFVFDQDWSIETNYGLAVGLDLADGRSELRLVPIRIERSQPYVLRASEREARLKRLAGISDKSLADGILAGALKFEAERITAMSGGD
jgi:poly-gamma-glutamate synthesis protein (capsule biosynthesis protein)